MTDYSELEERIVGFEPYVELWNVATAFFTAMGHWLYESLQTIDGAQVVAQMKTWSSSLFRLVRTLEPSAASAAGCSVATDLRTTVMKFESSHLPTVKCFRGGGLTVDHWKEMQDVLADTGVALPDLDNLLSLHDLIELRIHDQLYRIEHIAARATAQHVMATLFRKLQAEFWAQQAEWDVVAHPTPVLTNGPELLALLDGQVLDLQMMVSGGLMNADGFKNNLQLHTDNLKACSGMLTLFVQCQTIWIDLHALVRPRPQAAEQPAAAAEPEPEAPAAVAEPAAEDAEVAAEQGPMAAHMDVTAFVAVDEYLSEAVSDMRTQTKHGFFRHLLDFPEYQEELPEHIATLDTMLDVVAGQVKQMQLGYPRLFLVNSALLLTVVERIAAGQSSKAVKELWNCFAPGVSVQCDDAMQTIVGMGSGPQARRNRITFEEPVEVSVFLHEWLPNVEKQMQLAVASAITSAAEVYPESPTYRNPVKSRGSWLLLWPQQALQCCDQLAFTRSVERVLEGMESSFGIVAQKNALKEYGTTVLEANRKVDIAAKNINLVLLGIKAGETIAELSSKKDFKWQSALRHYQHDTAEDGEGPLVLRMQRRSLKYGCEFLGDTYRLAITPDVDRFHRATFAEYANALFGPSTSAKVASAVDLSTACGHFCSVLRCNPGTTAESFDVWMQGVSGSGIWGCVSGYEKLEYSIMCHVAEIARRMCDLLAAALPHPVAAPLLEGWAVAIDRCHQLFVGVETDRPGSRINLPLLTAVRSSHVLSAPNIKVLIEIRLVAHGFRDAAKHAANISLCCELLEHSLPQAVIFLTRQFVADLITAARMFMHEGNDETHAIVGALNDLVGSRVPATGREIFDSTVAKSFKTDLVLKSVFPAEFILKYAAKNNLYAADQLVANAQRLYDLVHQPDSTCTILLGPPAAGKTSCYTALAQALVQQAKQAKQKEAAVVCHSLYLKAHSSDDMLAPLFQIHGHGQPGKAPPGAIPHLLRQLDRTHPDSAQWVVVDLPDGDLSLLPIFTRGTSEVSRPEHIHVLFETASVKNASPAFLSGSGVVYIDPIDPHACPTEQVVRVPQQWRAYQPELCKLWDQLIPQCIQAARESSSPIAHQPSSVLIDHLNETIKHQLLEIPDVFFKKLEKANELRASVQGVLIFSAVWVFGGTFSGPERQRFEILLRKILATQCADIVCELPIETNSFYDFSYVVGREKGIWRKWSMMVPEDAFTSLVVYDTRIGTADTFRVDYWIDMCMKHERPVLLTGPTSGKTLALRAARDRINVKIYGASAAVETKLSPVLSCRDATATELRAGLAEMVAATGSVGSTADDVWVVFVDDLNAGGDGRGGYDAPIELVRELIAPSSWVDDRGVHGRVAPKLTCQLIAATSASSCTPVPERCLRNFLPVGLSSCSEAVEAIFTGSVKYFTSILLLDARLTASLAAATIDMYKTLRKTLGLSATAAADLRLCFDIRTIAFVVGGLVRGLSASKQLFPGNQVGKKKWQRINPLLLFKEEHVEVVRGIWLAEAVRVFADRLPPEKLGLVVTMLEDVGLERFGTMLEREKADSVVFGAFLSEPAAGSSGAVASKVETRIGGNSSAVRFGDRAMLRARVAAHLVPADAAGHTSGFETITATEYGQSHLARICRVLDRPRGNLLCIGPAGHGKRSLCRLAAGLCGVQLIDLSLMPGSAADRLAAVKAAAIRAGLDRRPVTLLLDDAVLLEPAVLRAVAAASSGAGLELVFNRLERIELANKVRAAEDRTSQALSPVAAALSDDAAFRILADRMADSLHVLTCADQQAGWATPPHRGGWPASARALASMAAVDSFGPVPPADLAAAAEKLLNAELPGGLLEQGVPGGRRAAAEALAELHGRFEAFLRASAADGATAAGEASGKLAPSAVVLPPSKFAQLVRAFTAVVATRLPATAERVRVQRLGQRKLSGFDKLVDRAKDAHPKLEKALVKAKAKAKRLKAEQKAFRDDVNECRAAAKEANDAVTPLQLLAMQLSGESSGALGSTMPALQVVTENLQRDIDAKGVAEARGLRKPPKSVLRTLQAVAVLLKEDSVVAENAVKGLADGTPGWLACQHLLKDAGELKKRLFKLNKDAIKTATAEGARAVLAEAVLAETTTDLPKPIPVLHRWVAAVLDYVAHLEVARPLLKQLEEVAADLDVANLSAAAAFAALDLAMAAAEAHRAALARAVEDRSALAEQVAHSQELLEGALGDLTESIRAQQPRWERELAALERSAAAAPADAMLAAATATYLCELPPETRGQLVADWSTVLANGHGMVVSGAYGLLDVLGAAPPPFPEHVPLMAGEHLMASLAAVQLGGGIGGAAVLLDPHGVAQRWISTIGPHLGLHHPGAPAPSTAVDIDELARNERNGGATVRTVADAVSAGGALVVTGLRAGQPIPGLLKALLRRDWRVRHSMKLLRVGAAELPFDPRFRLYILATDHRLRGGSSEAAGLDPELRARCVIANFAATSAGLRLLAEAGAYRAAHAGAAAELLQAERSVAAGEDRRSELRENMVMAAFQAAEADQTGLGDSEGRDAGLVLQLAAVGKQLALVGPRLEAFDLPLARKLRARRAAVMAGVSEAVAAWFDVCDRLGCRLSHDSDGDAAAASYRGVGSLDSMLALAGVAVKASAAKLREAARSAAVAASMQQAALKAAHMVLSIDEEDDKETATAAGEAAAAIAIGPRAAEPMGKAVAMALYTAAEPGLGRRHVVPAALAFIVALAEAAAGRETRTGGPPTKNKATLTLAAEADAAAGWFVLTVGMEFVKKRDRRLALQALQEVPGFPAVCPPDLKARTPAHAKQLGWYVEFESRVTQGLASLALLQAQPDV